MTNRPLEPDTTKLPQSRVALLRETAVFQLKLLADGFRDALLIPLSLLATLIGLLRGGDEPDREFRKVIKLGRRSERWIDLFGSHQPRQGTHPARSLDSVLDLAESVFTEQYQKGKSAEEARSAIREAFSRQDSGQGPGDASR